MSGINVWLGIIGIFWDIRLVNRLIQTFNRASTNGSALSKNKILVI